MEIVDTLNRLTGGHALYEVFNDWVECSAIAIQNGCTLQSKLREKREDRYEQILKKYSGLEAQEIFSEAFAQLVELATEEIRDILNEIYMSSGMGNKATGQFFTPFNISRLNAKLSLNHYKGEVIKLNEPTCGSGGMIIACAKELQEMGYNYQNKMKVVAQDLEFKCVYMCYLQLSLYGIDAVVIQGDTLNNHIIKSSQIWRTPRNMGVLI